MPRRKDKTPGSDKVRERVVKVMKMLIALERVEYRQDFAKDIGSDPARVSGWERGSGHPTLENLTRLYDKYRVSAEYILGGKEPMFKK